jgi:hypothetical protein
MSTPKYMRKFGAYYDYWLSGRFRREYEGFPTILVVTTDYGPEERIAEAARRAAAERPVPLPALITQQRLVYDSDGSKGPLHPASWREPGSGVSRRRHWLA